MEWSLQDLPTLINSVLPHLYLLLLAVFLGIEVIGRVPQVLHTPDVWFERPVRGGRGRVHPLGRQGRSGSLARFGFGLLVLGLSDRECGGWICRYRAYAQHVPQKEIRWKH